MIPASCKESVSYTDKKDGIVYLFKPKTGALERQLSAIALADGLSAIETNDKLDVLVDTIVIGWNDKEKRLPDFKSVKVSDFFNSEEKWMLIRFWNEANILTAEEKKS